MKVIAFYLFDFGYRGTNVATFDYAYYNQSLLNNISLIIFNNDALLNSNSSQKVLDKFIETFPCIKFKTEKGLLKNLKKLKKEEGGPIFIDYVYCLKYGKKSINVFPFNNDIVFKIIPTLIHCVFDMDKENEHGYKYVGVSKSVSKGIKKESDFKYVDHMINLPDDIRNLRYELNIDQNALVFGRLGGTDTFDIPFVKEVILDILDNRDYGIQTENPIYFIFAVRPEMLKDHSSPRLIFLDHFWDPTYKRKFINTCDAMIHASSLGESQGLNILEFMYCGKPIITHNGGLWHRQHLENLGDLAIKYNNEKELLNIITNFKKRNIDYSKILKKFSPENIMNDFNNIFLK